MDSSGFDDQSVATAETPTPTPRASRAPPSSERRPAAPARRTSTVDRDRRPQRVVDAALLKDLVAAEKRHDREVRRFLRGGGGDGREADDVPRALTSLGLDNDARAVRRLALPTASAARRASVRVNAIIPGHLRDVNDWLRGGAPGRTLDLGDRAESLRRDVQHQRRHR